MNAMKGRRGNIRASNHVHVCLYFASDFAYVIQDTGAGFMYRPVCCR